MKWFNRFTKIVIVEDDSALLKAMELKFKAEGYTVCSVTRGNDVARVVVNEKPKAILLDLMLPGADVGYTGAVIVLSNLSGRAGLSEEAQKYNALYFDKASTPIDDVVHAVAQAIKRS